MNNPKRYLYCPLCKSEAVDVHSYDETDEILQCEDCGNTFTVDQIDKIYIDEDDGESSLSGYMPIDGW